MKAMTWRIGLVFQQRHLPHQRRRNAAVQATRRHLLLERSGPGGHGALAVPERTTLQTERSCSRWRPTRSWPFGSAVDQGPGHPRDRDRQRAVDSSV